MTGLSSRFQRKNWFKKIWNGSQDIGQNVPKYAGLVWRPKFWHILVNFLGPGAYYSKPIFVFKPLCGLLVKATLIILQVPKSERWGSVLVTLVSLHI